MVAFMKYMNTKAVYGRILIFSVLTQWFEDHVILSLLDRNNFHNSKLKKEADLGKMGWWLI